MARIIDLMNAISKMEGWGVKGSIATRNNNPGNLRSGLGQTGSEETVNGKFATFANEADGWRALRYDIEVRMREGKSLREFIYQYAPPTENKTDNYLSYVVGKLGVDADSKLSDLQESVNG